MRRDPRSAELAVGQVKVGGPEHAMHRWKSVFHLDGCHHYHNAFQCACGAYISISGERSFKPMPSMMADLEECERCQALAAGARRIRTRRVITYPKGATWEPQPRQTRRARS